MDNNFRLECISGVLKGSTWTFREGMEYRIGRNKGADIRTPDGEMSIARENTVLKIMNGTPYIGSCKVNDRKSVGTWLNGFYLVDRADDYDMEKGWQPLSNDDIISIGLYGEDMKFRFNCPDRQLSMSEIRVHLERELRNPQNRRPQNILKNAKTVDPDRVKGQVGKAMEKIYQEKDLSVRAQKDFPETVYEDIGEKRAEFTEIDISEERSIVSHILDNARIQNRAVDDREEILASGVRIEEFVPGISGQISRQKKLETEENVSVFLAASSGKNYKTNFAFDTIKQIGKGGFSNVFLIRDQRDDELLVLKSLDVVREMTREQEAKCLREADLGERLDHKNLVKTYDIRKHNGNYYMIMEYCDGGSVADRMKEFYGYLDLDEATDYILQVLDGLDYLHNAEIEQPDQNGNMRNIKGVVHRDIKPENMLIKNVNGKKVVKISDFGLSKSYQLAGESGVTNGGAAGSLKYCSKRQFSDNYRYAGPQEDVFSAAASYYEMITGKCIRDRNKFKNLHFAILAGSKVPVRAANPHVPRELAEVLDSVLQEEDWGSSGRFTTAGELKEKIKNALNIQ